MTSSPSSSEKVLWVTVDLLHPLDKGGRLRTYNILKHLKQTTNPTYAGLNQVTTLEAITNADAYCDKLISVPVGDLGGGVGTKILNLLLSLVAGLPYSVYRDRSTKLRDKIALELSSCKYSYIVCDFVMAWVNLPVNVNIPVILFQHNVETNLWLQRYKNEKNVLKKVVFYLQYRSMFKFEAKAVSDARGVIAVSGIDANEMRRQFAPNHVEDIPTAVDLEYFKPWAKFAKASKSQILFTGSLDWEPNIEGITWFLENVFELIQQKVPDVSLCVVGRNPTKSLIQTVNRVSGVRLVGRVPDVRPEMASSSVSVVPLLTGGGTRIKIFESFAFGLPVVSTTIGAEGLDAQDGIHLILADKPEAFANAVINLLVDKRRSQAISDSASVLVSSRFGAQEVALDFNNKCRSILQIEKNKDRSTAT